jgi:CHASE2 domain-containing sensor protein
MLNQYERRQFNDIAHRLHTDPDFARLTRPDEPAFPTVSVLCAFLVIIGPLLVLLGGWATFLPTLILFSATITVVLLRRQRRDR